MGPNQPPIHGYKWLFAKIKRPERETEHFFLHGVGPHSRCYGRTTALRLFVQPCDEDEQFFTKFYN
jgi:hypothetical protein